MFCVVFNFQVGICKSLLLSCIGDQGSGRLESTSPLTVNPSVVVGTKAVEAAYQEGKWPVVDKTVDVYALQCSPGMSSEGSVTN